MQHLAVLERSGLVHTRRPRRYKFHHIDTTPQKADVLAGGARRLTAVLDDTCGNLIRIAAMK